MAHWAVSSTYTHTHLIAPVFALSLSLPPRCLYIISYLWSTNSVYFLFPVSLLLSLSCLFLEWLSRVVAECLVLQWQTPDVSRMLRGSLSCALGNAMKISYQKLPWKHHVMTVIEMRRTDRDFAGICSIHSLIQDSSWRRTNMIVFPLDIAWPKISILKKPHRPKRKTIAHTDKPTQADKQTELGWGAAK